MLSKQQLEKYRKKLLANKEELEKEIAELESPSDFGDESGESDETQEAEEDINNASSAGILRQGLDDIDAALERIDDGAYGVDENTGEDIPLEALDVNPTLRFHPRHIREGRE